MQYKMKQKKEFRDGFTVQCLARRNLYSGSVFISSGWKF